MSEITQFTDIINHTFRDTLVVLDIDGTMLRLTGVLSDPGWWKGAYASHFERTSDYNEAEEATLAEWKQLAKNSSAEHTDEYGLNRIISEARDAGNVVISLTARAPEMQEFTKEHLDFLAIELTHVKVPNDVCFNSHGVFYAGGDNKGDTLLKICDHFRGCGMKISRVIFVDDVDHHVKNVANALDSTDMDGQCFIARF